MWERGHKAKAGAPGVLEVPRPRVRRETGQRKLMWYLAWPRCLAPAGLSTVIFMSFVCITQEKSKTVKLRGGVKKLLLRNGRPEI
jgi:hypothetical protein